MWKILLCPIFQKRLRGFLTVGFSTLALELFVIWYLGTHTSLAYALIVAFTFSISSVIGYILDRRYAYFESDRQIFTGYLYFITIALISMAITISGAILIIKWFHADQYIARILIAALVAPMNFLINGIINFKVIEKI